MRDLSHESPMCSFTLPDIFLLFRSGSVADPGFPRGGGANSRGGAPTYDFAKFSQKLHEIERIWAPLRSATAGYLLLIKQLLTYETIT